MNCTNASIVVKMRGARISTEIVDWLQLHDKINYVNLAIQQVVWHLYIWARESYAEKCVNLCSVKE